jgi:hypothetical protein
MTEPTPPPAPAVMSAASTSDRPQYGDQQLWADDPDVLEACVAGRLALWATAHVTAHHDGGWMIVDDAGNPLDVQAIMPGRAIVSLRAAAQRIRVDQAIVPPDLSTAAPLYGREVHELRFDDRDAAEAFVADQRRRAAWHVMWRLLHPRPGNLDDLNPRTVDLYRSLCMDDTYTPDERHQKVLDDRLAPERSDCLHHGLRGEGS